jgi:hypothetical protein
MRLILAALGAWHQPLSSARLVELTGPAFSTALLSISKLRNNGIISTGTIDRITHYEVSDATPAATKAVTR